MTVCAGNLLFAAELVVSLGEEHYPVRVVEKKHGEATVHINGKVHNSLHKHLIPPLFFFVLLD